MEQKGVLVIQHAPWEGPGIIGTLLQERSGFETVRIYRKERPPVERIERNEFLAVVGLGSPSCACGPNTGGRCDEIELFRLVRRLGIPSFMICYSMQLFCVAHGGTVEPNPNGKEVGFFDVHLTKDGEHDAVFSGVGDFRTLQWHVDSVSRLPEGAVHLAYSDKTLYQAAVLDGIHYMVQGDGQAASESIVKSWFNSDGAWALDGTAVVPEDIVGEAHEREAYYYDVYRRIFCNFLDLANRRFGKTKQELA